MLAADRGQAEGAVLRGVLLPSRTEEAQVDEADAGGKHPFPAQAGSGEVTGDRPAYARQRRAELQHPVVLAAVPLFPPQIVVAVLTAARGVSAHGLDVAGRIGADPDVLPGRRDDERLDAGQGLRIPHRPSARAEVAEPSAAAPAPDIRGGRVAAGQSCPGPCGHEPEATPLNAANSRS